MLGPRASFAPANLWRFAPDCALDPARRLGSRAIARFVRAGVAEGGLKSDFTIDSPVATLSKRGTWNFALYYERETERFEISLLDRGLVEAIDKEFTGLN